MKNLDIRVSTLKILAPLVAKETLLKISHPLQMKWYSLQNIIRAIFLLFPYSSAQKKWRTKKKNRKKSYSGQGEPKEVIIIKKR